MAAALLGSLRGQVSTRQDTFSFTPTHRVDTLSFSPVVAGGWAIYDEEGGILDPALVSIEPVPGIIRWVAPVAGQRWVAVRYQVLEGLTTTVVGPAWRFLPPLGAVGGDSAATSPATGLSRTQPTGRMVTAGSLFRGLSITSGRGVNITGGLNLQLQGELARGIFLNGSLTDQNLPIQPEGNTRTLNELDQVKLSINSRWGGVEVGDFVLKGPGGRLASFERKMEGMHIQLQDGNWRVAGALAGSPGRFRSQAIQGQDGRQGPYPLTSNEGSRTLIVLPGTEVVWLNGKRLERGDGLDYTIDYATGEISFTPRHTIRSDSRIVVDFEYTDMVYNRTTGYLSTAWQGERSGLTITALTERDNLESNLEFSLSAEDRRYLRGIGDQGQAASVSTAVPDSAGNYDLVEGRYVWRGESRGDHSVSFFNVGEQGQYRRVVAGGRIIYQWVPPEDRPRYNASYAPFRVLKLPRRQDVVTAGWQLRGLSAGRLARVEVGLSSVDLNRYSPLDDQDNRDAGYVVQLQWRTKPLALAGRSLKAGLQLDALGKGRRFQPPGRWDAVEFQRDWDLDGQPAGYQWQTVDLFLEETAWQRVFAQLGRIKADSVGTSRLRWGLTRSGPAALTGRFTQTLLSRVNKERWWQLSAGELKYNYKGIAPFFKYYGEIRRGATASSYRVEQVTLGLKAELSPRTRAGLSRERRRDLFQAGLTETARLWRLSLSRSAPRGTRLTTTLSFNEKLTSDERDDLAYLMGDLSLVHRPAGRPWWLDLRYRLERTMAETKAVMYDSVGAGLGQYRYDRVYDTYVPDEAGPYVRLVIPAGEVRPVTMVKTRFRLQVDLNRTRRPFGPLKDFSEARLILQGRLAAETEKHSLATYWKPALEDTSAVNVRSRLQVDFALQQQSRRPQYRLRFLQVTRLSREAVGGTGGRGLPGEALEKTSAELGRVSRHRLAGRVVNLELRLGYERKLLQSLLSALRNHDILKVQGKATLAGTVVERLTASLTGKWQDEVDRELDDLRVRTVSWGAGVQRTIGARGRLRLDVERFQVAASRETAIPYLLAGGFPAGRSRRVRASGQLNLSRNLLLTLTLFSRREAGRDSFMNANLELRTQL